MSSDKLWLPLEANPQIINDYIEKLGADGHLQFYDVLGLDPELLTFVPQPVLAIVLLFPISELEEKHRKDEDKVIRANGQIVSDRVYFMKQVTGNACGTVGIIHTVMNLRDQFEFKNGRFFANFFESTRNMTPEERAKALDDNEEVEEAHESAAADGESKVPNDLEDVNLHFVSFVLVDGQIYEFDGRKSFPINHGPSSPETFLMDAANVVQVFMSRNPESLNFNLCALGPK